MKRLQEGDRIRSQELGDNLRRESLFIFSRLERLVGVPYK